MNFRTTLVLLACLAVFFGAFLYVQKVHPEAEEGKAPALLGSFDRDRVEAVRVENLEMGYRVGLGRAGADEWRMTEPLEAPADEALASQILSSVAYNTGKPVVELGKGGSVDLAQYGLEKPRAILDFELKGPPGRESERTKRRLLVGGEDLRKDDVFCGIGPAFRPGEESKWSPTAVVRTPANVYNSVNKTVEQYRDHRVFSIKGYDAESLEVARDGGVVLSLAKEEGNWHLRVPRRERADASAASGFVNQVLGWRIGHFVPDPPEPDGALGLDPPRIEIVAKGSGRTETLRIGKEVPDGRAGRRLDSKFVWVLKSDDVGGLEKDSDEFLDKRLFRFFSDEVTEVRIGRPEGEIVLGKEGGKLRLKSLKDLEVASDRKDDLLSALEKLEIGGFEPPLLPPPPAGESRPANALEEALKRYGLDAASRWIQVATKGKPSKLLVGTSSGESGFVRREGSENVGRVKSADLDRVLSRGALHYVTREIVNFSEFDLAAIEIEARRPPETQPSTQPAETQPASQPAPELRLARWIREEGGKWMREKGGDGGVAPAEDAAFTAAIDSIVRMKGDEARQETAEGIPLEAPLAVVRYFKGTPTSRPAAGAKPDAEVKIAEKGGTVAVGPSGIVYAIASDLVSKIRNLP